MVFDTETQPGHKFVKIVLDARPPEILHVLTGEIIYQLRSALDQTAVAFARLSKGAGGKKPKPSQVHFPTGDSAKGFLSSCGTFDRVKGRLAGNLRWFDSDLRKAIMRTKPYDGGNETMRAVFRMANIDKHMELIAIGTSGGVSIFGDITINDAYRGLIASRGDLNDGVIISDLRPEGSFTISGSDPKIYVSGQITLGDIAPYSGKALVPFLTSMIKEVGRAHADFEQLLIGRGAMAARADALGPNPIGWGFRYRIAPR